MAGLYTNPEVGPDTGRVVARIEAVKSITKKLDTSTSAKVATNQTLIDVGNNGAIYETQGVAKLLGIKESNVTLTDIVPREKLKDDPEKVGMQFVQIVDNKVTLPPADFMMMFQVIHHISNKEFDPWLRSMLGNLKMGGSLIIKEHDLPLDEADARTKIRDTRSDARAFMIRTILARHPREDAHCWLTSHDALTQILEVYGMKLAEFHTYDTRNPMGIYHARYVRVREFPSHPSPPFRVEYDWRNRTDVEFMTEERYNQIRENRNSRGPSWRGGHKSDRR